MADEAPTAPEPKEVEYHPVTGVPEEFHEYLHKDSEEFKKLKAWKESEASEITEKVAKTSIEVRILLGPSVALGIPSFVPHAFPWIATVHHSFS